MNPGRVRPSPARSVGSGPIDFHRRLPGYRATPLVALPALARELDLDTLHAKIETDRYGLPSFKVLGASWAIYRLLCQRLGGEPAWSELDELRRAVAGLGPLQLVAATEGNHGRAVAFMARLLGLTARILVPQSVDEGRRSAIVGEGAELVVIDGTYDDAVGAAAQLAGERSLVVADTSWPGYDEVPTWIVEGYATMFAELPERSAFDLVSVQMGVGSLATAVVDAFADTAAILVAEPSGAACGQASAVAGRLVSVPGPHDSVMAGLNCGTPSSLAWPRLSGGVDAFVAIDDRDALRAVTDLAAAGIPTGPAGAAGLAAVRRLHEAGGGEARSLLAGAKALVVCTEAPLTA